MWVRLDRADDLVVAMRLDAASSGFLIDPKRTEEGYLVTDAVIAKPGVLFYKLPNGSFRRELVLPEELGSPASMATVAHKPVTLEHPKTLTGLLDPKTVQRFTQGTVTGEARIDAEGRMVVPVVVQAQGALDAIDGGTREISAGYNVTSLDMTPGVHPEYGAYDAIQRGRTYNHVALTTRGRAGRDVTIRTDACVEVDAFPVTVEVPMRPFVLALMAAGMTQEQADASHDGLLSAANTNVRNDHASELEVAKSDLEAEKLRADTADQALKDGSTLEVRLGWHTERTRLDALALGFKLEDTAALDSPELGRKVLEAAKVECEGKSDEWVSARCDSLELPKATEPGGAFKVVSIPGKPQARMDSDEPAKRHRGPHRSVARYSTNPS